MEIRRRADSYTSTLILQHVLRTEPTDAPRIAWEIVHSHFIAAVEIGVPNGHYFIAILVEDSQLGEEGVDGEGEGALEGETASVQAFGLVHEAFEVSVGEGIAVVIEEVARGHREGSVVVPSNP